jgi:hypothetical protein
MSILETLINTGTGFIISILTTQIVLPQYDCPVTLEQNMGITTIFTVVSIVRGYAVRRLFNWYATWQMNSARRRGLSNAPLKDKATSND